MSPAWIILHVISFPLGRLLAAAVEWSAHRYLLHGLGKKRGSLLSFHYRDHHRACRRNQMHDAEYVQGMLFDDNGRAREFWPVILGCVLVVVLCGMWAPLFALGGVYGGVLYLYMHHRAHADPQWCLRHAPWHYEHHMAPNQDVNWGVTNEWFDKLMGTRVSWEKAPRSDADRILSH